MAQRTCNVELSGEESDELENMPATCKPEPTIIHGSVTSAFASAGDARINEFIEKTETRLSALEAALGLHSPSTTRPGRPRTKTQTKLCIKLWEFLRNLLMDSSTCPRLIRWENYKEGSFKLKQSKKIAKLWGDYKNKRIYNEKKFFRAIRYYCRSQALLQVNGKGYLFKFGPKTTSIL